MRLARQIVEGTYFQRAVIAVIAFSALLLGLETNAALVAEHRGLFRFLDRAVVAFFLVEIALKFLAEKRRPWRFFRDPWNCFDFVIVAASLVPSGSSAVAVFRLVRVLRIFRLITALPKLRLIVSAMLRSLPAMGSVSLLLCILFYTYAVLGVFLFGRNDPANFGSLGSALLSLFAVLTLEGWVDTMKIQMLGCVAAGGEAGSCGVSQAQPLAAVLYFVSFIVIGTMIFLNLLIGVVVGSLTEEAEANAKPSPERETEVLLRRIQADLAELRARTEKERPLLEVEREPRFPTRDQ